MALFIVTEKRGETAQALEDLKGTWEVLRPGTRAGTMLATPQVRLTDKRAALRATFEGRVLRTVVLFTDLLLRKKRLGELETIVHEFEALVERQQGVQRAHAVSAVPLATAERERLHRELERTTGKKIRMTSEVDASLLGGVLVRIGDRVIDRSVRTLLDTIEQQLMETSV
jgi:F-type H+-transporting ATPase subunit delta